MDQEKYFKCLHELKQEKENRMKAQKDKASESDKTSESDEASGSKKSAELKETSGSEKIENAEKANHPGVKRSPEMEKIDFRQLSVKYQQLTSRLLDTVKGQDEAVMEFVQGCFRGELFHILEKEKDLRQCSYLQDLLELERLFLQRQEQSISEKDDCI